MPDYLLLMHADAPSRVGTTDAWPAYLAALQASGRLRGGSAIGAGVCVRKSGPAPAITGHLAGFIRVEAETLEQARTLLAGNPVFEAGGTVEIRELPQSE